MLWSAGFGRADHTASASSWCKHAQSGHWLVLGPSLMATIWSLTQSLMKADESNFITGYTVIWLLQGLPHLLDTMFQQCKDWCSKMDELMVTRYVDLSLQGKPYEFKALSELLRRPW